MKRRLFLGIDVSTTGAKALLIGKGGEVVASGTTPLSLATPHPLWSEQEPEDWWKAACKATKAVLKKAKLKGNQITGVGLSGQMNILMAPI